jgi:hypothetical protein
VNHERESTMATAMEVSAISGLTTPRIPGNLVEGIFSLSDIPFEKTSLHFNVGIVR